MTTRMAALLERCRSLTGADYIVMGKAQLQETVCRRVSSTSHGARFLRRALSRDAPARLVEEELTDRDRPGVFRRPIWLHIPVMEIQRAVRSIG
jgi:hypothetical protein